MKLRIACIAIIVLLLVFIWGNSLLSKNVSTEISKWIANIIASLFGVEGNSADTVNGAGILRKIAHFVEFSLLGAALSIFLRLTVHDKRFGNVLLVLVGVAVALADETIQIFSGRGPLISDVWLDIGGYIFGCMAVGVFIAAKRRIMAKKRPQSEKRT